jgi:lipopolysaccharide export system protein LptA
MSFRHVVKLCLLLSFTGSALALPEDRDQPVNVSADQASFNEKTGTAVYRGNILVQQGSLRISADELVLTMDAKGTVVSAVARGNPASFEQRPRADHGPAVAEAMEVTYQAVEGIVTFNGKARLRQEGASFQGASISYSLERGEIEARGDKQTRVQLSFPPPPKNSRISKKLGEPAP